MLNEAGTSTRVTAPPWSAPAAVLCAILNTPSAASSRGSGEGPGMWVSLKTILPLATTVRAAEARATGAARSVAEIAMPIPPPNGQSRGALSPNTLIIAVSVSASPTHSGGADTDARADLPLSTVKLISIGMRPWKSGWEHSGHK
eukprot:2514312-Pleurochrysis_carterae.AAC.5